MLLPASPSKPLNYLSNNTNDKHLGSDIHEKPNPFISSSHRERDGVGEIAPPNLDVGG